MAYGHEEKATFLEHVQHVSFFLSFFGGVNMAHLIEYTDVSGAHLVIIPARKFQETIPKDNLEVLVS